MKIEIPIFIINLKRDALKKKHMQTLCSKYNLQHIFFEAIDGKALSNKDIDSVYSNTKALSTLNRELGKGEIGCSLSHLGIYKKMVEASIPKAVIFEDDIILSKNFSADLKNIIQNTPDNFDCILLGSHSHSSREKECKTKFFNRIKIRKGLNIEEIVEIGYGAYGYLISLKGAKKILSENEKIFLPLDRCTGNYENFNIYKISPSIIFIHEELTNNHSNLEAERTILNAKNSKNRTTKPINHFSLVSKIKCQLSSFYYFMLITKKQLKP